MSWRPVATPDSLRLRAAVLDRARRFFATRGVLEVDTPILVNAAVSDVHIESAEVRLPGSRQPYFLHTSPEYAMKRLLAAGSGDIYQIARVVRGHERGRLHNPEFTLIEWYRCGFSLEDLMDEVDALVRELVREPARKLASERVTWRDAFARHAGIDPVEASDGVLREAARGAGLADASAAGSDRDGLLDHLMGTRVGPRLGREALTFVHRYPASQAALAKLDASDPRFALRFELYCQGIELANGFSELASPLEQRARFERDQAARRRRGLATRGLDERLLAALEAGLPDCAGVAVGFDRVLMLAAGAARLDDVLPFPIERA
jgi:elongation factor P--(R)-beta-lysine ligase